MQLDTIKSSTADQLLGMIEDVTKEKSILLKGLRRLYDRLQLPGSVWKCELIDIILETYQEL